ANNRQVVMPCACLRASTSRFLVRQRRGWPGHRRAEATPSFGRLCPAMTEKIMTANIPTLASLAEDLASGRTSSRKLVDACLARSADPAGEGMRAFIHVDAEAAIEAAEAMDRLREVKAAPSPFAGIPVSIKDLFDIRGQVTRAGSRALEDSAPAEADAAVVARLRRA